MPIPSPTQFKRIAARHWIERRRYARFSDWLLSIYNRVLIHARSLPLPGRRMVRSVYLSDVRQKFQIRLGTSDWYVLEEIFLNDEYGPLTSLHLSGIHAILDLGANVGMSVRLWQTLWPKSRIVAVEPDAANLEVARQNADESCATPLFIRACVAGRSRTVHLDRSKDEYSFKMLDGAEGGEQIDALTVPQLCERGALPAIDLLKCDVEGAEAEIFADCAEWIAQIRYLAVEVHAPYTEQRLLHDLARAGVTPAWTKAVSKGDLALIFVQIGKTGSEPPANIPS